MHTPGRSILYLGNEKNLTLKLIFDLEEIKILKKMKISFNVCHLKSVLSKFQPSITILKNDLEISENWFFDLEKIEILKKIETSFLMCSVRTVLSKFQISITILKKMTLKILKKGFLTLKKFEKILMARGGLCQNFNHLSLFVQELLSPEIRKQASK